MKRKWINKYKTQGEKNKENFKIDPSIIFQSLPLSPPPKPLEYSDFKLAF